MEEKEKKPKLHDDICEIKTEVRKLDKKIDELKSNDLAHMNSKNDEFKNNMFGKFASLFGEVQFIKGRMDLLIPLVVGMIIGILAILCGVFID